MREGLWKLQEEGSGFYQLPANLSLQLQVPTDAESQVRSACPQFAVQSLLASQGELRTWRPVRPRARSCLSRGRRGWPGTCGSPGPGFSSADGPA